MLYDTLTYQYDPEQLLAVTTSAIKNRLSAQTQIVPQKGTQHNLCHNGEGL